MYMNVVNVQSKYEGTTLARVRSETEDGFVKIEKYLES